MLTAPALSRKQKATLKRPGRQHCTRALSSSRQQRWQGQTRKERLGRGAGRGRVTAISSSGAALVSSWISWIVAARKWPDQKQKNRSRAGGWFRSVERERVCRLIATAAPLTVEHTECVGVVEVEVRELRRDVHAVVAAPRVRRPPTRRFAAVTVAGIGAAADGVVHSGQLGEHYWSAVHALP
eukprot:COSAG01_NODE_1041_length_11959_cov_2.673356_6_plen_183_part_00